MQILVTFVSTNARGMEQREQRRIDGTVFTLGRATQCQIHLPDARVEQEHARITVGETGAIIESQPAVIVHNDREVGGAQLFPGDIIEIGPYVLIVETPPEGVPLSVSIRMSKRGSTQKAALRYRVLLRGSRLSKRRLSYVAFFGVLALSLFAPIAADLLEDADLPLPESMVAPGREALRALGAGFVQTWNPGPLARSHATFGHDCRSCHELPFIQVRDNACSGCHAAVREHVPRAQLVGAMAVAFQETRCAECHRDHKGQAMAPRAQELCTDCHANIQHANPKGQVLNASDFGKDHPAFRLSLVDADRPKEIRRVRQRDPAAGPITERSNLKFNHTLHLDPAGVRDPRGKRAPGAKGDAANPRSVLGCESCHQPDERVDMAPISMEKHCSQCHALSFEPQVTQRQVPHGPVKQIETMLREFYARLVLGEVPPGVVPPRDLPRLRPGAVLTAEDRQQAMKIADQRSRRVMDELMDKRAVCGTCHHVSRPAKGEWQVAPVVLTAAWMPGSAFSHAKHSTRTCISCHDVRGSRRAEDVSMPEIAGCRECHGGAAALPGKLASDCATCHRFHGGEAPYHGPSQARQAPWPSQ
jgi:pSer/pThr/pTyr-binding forkhead associated (FHA) protein